MSDRLLVFAYADRGYESFVLPFVYFCLRNNAEAHVEVCLEDEAAFARDAGAGVDVLQALYPGRFTLRQSEVACLAPSTVPGTVRFLETPRRKAEYVYIGDIDILVFEDLLSVHLGLMRAHGLPYSNIVRPGSVERGRPQLSGLHFAPYALQYPVRPPALDFGTENDEHVLYAIMRDKDALVPATFRERPVCGIHMSPNRDPAGRTTGPTSAVYTTQGALRWPKEAYHERFLAQVREPGFLRLLPELDLGMKLRLLVVEGLATQRTRELHRLTGNMLVDKRLQVGTAPMAREKTFADIAALLAAGDAPGADTLASTACQVWPESAPAWEWRARTLLRVGDMALAVEALLHLSDLPGGAQRIAGLPEWTAARDRILDAVPERGRELLGRLDAVPCA